jgi:threonine/homoserine/homoserine lactone efflux protein
MSGFIPPRSPSAGPSKLFEHSKAAGYAVVAILLAAFVGWAKFALISSFTLLMVGGAAVLLFVSWRAISGTWPGNDPKK